MDDEDYSQYEYSETFYTFVDEHEARLEKIAALREDDEISDEEEAFMCGYEGAA